jgi:hypothetical protein
MKAIGMQLRAGVLEQMVEETISVIEIPGNQIRFYRPSPLLMWRASSVLSTK